MGCDRLNDWSRQAMEISVGQATDVAVSGRRPIHGAAQFGASGRPCGVSCAIEIRSRRAHDLDPMLGFDAEKVVELMAAGDSTGDDRVAACDGFADSGK